MGLIPWAKAAGGRADLEPCPTLHQVMRYESVTVKESAGLDPAALSPANPREKWLRKRTQVKLRVRALWHGLRVWTVAPGSGAAAGLGKRGPGDLAPGEHRGWASGHWGGGVQPGVEQRWTSGLRRCGLESASCHDRGASRLLSHRAWPAVEFATIE